MKCGDEGREGCEGKKQKGKKKAARRRRGKKKACVKGQKAASKRREGRGGAVLGVCAVRAGWLVGRRVCNVSCGGGKTTLFARLYPSSAVMPLRELLQRVLFAPSPCSRARFFGSGRRMS